MESEAQEILIDNCGDHEDTSEGVMSGGKFEKSQLQEKSNVRLILIIV